MLGRTGLESARQQIWRMSKVWTAKETKSDDFKWIMDNQTDPNASTCNLCNIPGTETCHVDGKCICKLWYSGEYCQTCHFTNDFVLTPNGTCVLCPCNGRPAQECFQDGLCALHSTVALKEATAASAIFMATLACIALVSVYLLYRIMKRTKHLRSMAGRDYRSGDYPVDQDGANEEGGVFWKEDEHLVETGGQGPLLTPISDGTTGHSTTTSLFYTRSPNTSLGMFPGRKSISTFFSNFNRRKNKTTKRVPANFATSTPALLLSVENANADLAMEDCEYPRGLRISSSCSEYYFLSVQMNPDDNDELEHEM